MKAFSQIFFVLLVFSLSCSSQEYKWQQLKKVAPKQNSLSEIKTALNNETNPENPLAIIREVSNDLDSYKQNAEDTLKLAKLYGKDKDKRKKPKDKNIKKKKAKPCYFSAGTAIRTARKKGKKKKFLTRLVGNAQVRCDKTLLYSHSVNIEGKKGKTIRLKRYVKIIDTENGTVLTGGYAEYFKYHKYARILEKPKIIRKDKKTGQLTTIESFSLKRDFSKKKSYCLGNVKIKQGDWTALTDKAVFDEKKDIITLKGGPVVYRFNEVYSADSIIIINRKGKRDGKFIMEGNVRLLTYGQKDSKNIKNSKVNNSIKIQNGSSLTKQEQTEKKSTSLASSYSKNKDTNQSLVRMLITGEQFTRITTKNKEKTIGKRGILNPIRIWRQTSEIHADYFESQGKENELIFAKGNIILWDWARELMIRGDNITIHKKEDWGRMTSNPLVYLLNRKKENVSARISSMEILRLFDKNELHFNGSVVLSRYIDEAEVISDEIYLKNEESKKQEEKMALLSLSKKNSTAKNLKNLIVLNAKMNKDSGVALSFSQAKQIVDLFVSTQKSTPRLASHATGEEAIFFEQEDFLRIQGSSALRQGSSYLQAKKILYYPKENRIRLAEGIQAYLYPEGAK